MGNNFGFSGMTHLRRFRASALCQTDRAGRNNVCHPEHCVIVVCHCIRCVVTRASPARILTSRNSKLMFDRNWNISRRS